MPASDSITREIYTAIGQYLVYKTALQEKGWNIPLYLAVSKDITIALVIPLN
jgi:hypothetical protein